MRRLASFTVGSLRDVQEMFITASIGGTHQFEGDDGAGEAERIEGASSIEVEEATRKTNKDLAGKFSVRDTVSENHLEMLSKVV